VGAHGEGAARVGRNFRCDVPSLTAVPISSRRLQRATSLGPSARVVPIHPDTANPSRTSNSKHPLTNLISPCQRLTVGLIGTQPFVSLRASERKRFSLANWDSHSFALHHLLRLPLLSHTSFFPWISHSADSQKSARPRVIRSVFASPQIMVPGKPLPCRMPVCVRGRGKSQ